MLINSLLLKTQKLLNPIYKKSLILNNIDKIIFFNIIALILLSTILPSDSMGIFAIFGIILTSIKLLFKPYSKLNITLAEKYLLLYFLLVLISVAGSTLFLQSFKGFCKTLLYLGFYVSVVDFLKTNKSKIKYIFLAMAIACLGEVVVAIKQNFLSVAEISGWQDMSRLNPEQVMTRVYGSLKPYNPNLFGGYLLAILPSTLITCFIPLLNKHYKTATIGLIFLLLSLTAVILTGCRGAYLGLFAQIIIMAIIVYRFLKPFYKKIFTSFMLIMTGITSFIILATASLRARVFSIFAMRADSSNSFRFNVYNSCIDMFKDNWLLGIGVGNQNFREIYGLYMKTGFDALSAYNIYLETAVESGIFALITFVIFLSINIYSAVKYILKKSNITSIYLSIALVSIIGLLVHGFVDTVFFRPQIQFIFWIMIAIIRVLTIPRGIHYVGTRN